MRGAPSRRGMSASTTVARKSLWGGGTRTALRLGVNVLPEMGVKSTRGGRFPAIGDHKGRRMPSRPDQGS